MFEPGFKIYDNETIKNFEFPSAGYILKVHVYYDEPFYKKFGQDSKSIVTRINAVFSMVKTIYSDRASLTTVIIPKIIQIQHVKQAVWKATVDDLRKANDIASASETNADSYVFLGHEDNLPGTIGIAW